MFPATEQALKSEGYQFAGTGSCRGCGARLEWWVTPSGKRIPLEPVTFKAHFASCPKAKEFRHE